MSDLNAVVRRRGEEARSALDLAEDAGNYRVVQHMLMLGLRRAGGALSHQRRRACAQRPQRATRAPGKGAGAGRAAGPQAAGLPTDRDVWRGRRRGGAAGAAGAGGPGARRP